MQRDQFDLHARLESEHWWFRARRRIIQELVRALVPPGAGNMVLEVGCGTGGTLSIFASEYACCGIDPSAHGIELARHRFPQIEFRCGLAPEGVLDLSSRVKMLMLLDVLEHVEEDGALLSQLVSFLSPGSYCLLTVPADMHLWSPQDKNYGHFRRYDKEGLAKICQPLPVEIIMTSYFNSRLYPMVRLARDLNVWRRHSSGKAGTDLALPRPWLNALLERVFAGEAAVLSSVLGGRRKKGYTRGVSLLAILRRVGEIKVVKHD